MRTAREGLAELRDRLQRGTVDGLNDAAGHVLDVAKADTPTETGRTRDSGTVVPGVLTNSRAAVSIEFRNPIAPIVHEDLTVEHDNGKAKFLEDAMNSQRDEAAERVASRLRDILATP